MKCEAKRIETPPAFQPVELTLRFETAEELAAFYALFNNSSVTSAVSPINHDGIRGAITSANGKVPHYGEFHSRLCKVLR